MSDERTTGGDDSPELVGLDWGTSSLRGWLLDGRGRVLDRREAPLGVLAVADRRFAEAFERFCGPWLADRPQLPVIASGMIGSRQGWREAAYLPTPAPLEALAGQLLALDDEAGRPFRIVPGLVCRTAGGWPDVLRGEETQVAGLLGSGGAQGPIGSGGAPGRRLVVLPGTHSKWVVCEGTTVLHFRTWMTGELYALLRERSTLGVLCEEPPGTEGPAQRAAFDEGVDRALAAGAAGPLLFTVRSEALLGERRPEALPAYLSGILIGAEIVEALRALQAPDDAPGFAMRPLVVARPALAGRYLRALERAGLASEAASDETCPKGLFDLASHAGLIR